MGRKKQMIKKIIEDKRERVREKDREALKKQKKKREISEEEHQKRIKLLRNIGILKE